MTHSTRKCAKVNGLDKLKTKKTINRMCKYNIIHVCIYTRCRHVWKHITL